VRVRVRVRVCVCVRVHGRVCACVHQHASCTPDPASPHPPGGLGWAGLSGAGLCGEVCSGCRTHVNDIGEH
jgi:hypothetical protein